MKTKVLRVDNLTSKKTGKPFQVIWFTMPSGMTGRLAVFENANFNVGDTCELYFDLDYNMNVSVKVRHAN